jgi:hypothetical protein
LRELTALQTKQRKAAEKQVERLISCPTSWLLFIYLFGD